MHGMEGRTGSDASPLHGDARTGKQLLQQNLPHRDPDEPGSARRAVRKLHGSMDLHGMPDLDHCTELPRTHAAALQASRGCTSLHGSVLITQAKQPAHNTSKHSGREQSQIHTYDQPIILWCTPNLKKGPFHIWNANL